MVRLFLTALIARLLFGFVSLASSQADDWIQFGGANRNFTVPRPSPVPVESAFAWQRPIAGGDASVLAKDENLYVSTIDFAADGTDAHRILCLNKLNGNPIWEQVYAENSFVSQDISDRLPVRPISTPIIVGDKLIACGFGGSVRCLDRLTGKSLWAVDLGTEYGWLPIQYGYACSPWSDGNQVVIACGGEKALLLSLNVEDGTLKWKSGSGAASYTTPVTLSLNSIDSSTSVQHLVYAAGDEVIAVRPESGTIEWSYRYPESGLTNAVTPIAVAPGKLLIGGQGVKGTRLLSIEMASKGYEVTESWHNTKINPFYCNWVQLTKKPKCVLGFMGKTLTAFDWMTGEIFWQKRDWTDCNLLSFDDLVLAVRGDGCVGLLDVNDTGFEVVASGAPSRDRIWSTPVVVGQHLVLVGRNSIVCFPLNQLQNQSSIPSGTEVTSMDAMYGERPEAIKKLISLSKTPSEFSMREYSSVASDASIGLSESDYTKLIENLSKNDSFELSLEIANDWARRSPQSIAAWENRVRLLRKTGAIEQAEREVRERMVEVAIEVTLTDAAPIPNHVYLTGNVESLGPWKPDAIELQAVGDRKFRTQCWLPLGDFQFKFTSGSMDSVEVRSDGRSISNRRQRIVGPTTLNTIVQGWKKK